MLPGLSDLDLALLTKVLRRTVLVSIVAGVLGVVLALLFSQPFAAVGIAVGVGIAILNLRLLDSGVARVETKQESNPKILRKLVGAHSVARLGVITAIAIGLMLLDGPLGIGMVIGLVIFQILFVLNVGKAVIATGVA